VATATLGAWVGFQCLGTLIFEGFAQQNDGKILTGAVLVSALTIAIEVVLARLERRLSPWAVVPRTGPVDEPPEPALVAPSDTPANHRRA
jgi:ABC-type proline/glycine betaine transport system permease subunit